MNVQARGVQHCTNVCLKINIHRGIVVVYLVETDSGFFCGARAIWRSLDWMLGVQPSERPRVENVWTYGEASWSRAGRG